MKLHRIAIAALLSVPTLVEAQVKDLGPRDAASLVSVAPSADGVPIHFEVRGEPSEAPTLVLVHGWSHNLTFWEPHLSTLAATHQVVALDLAGFGESGARRADWTMEAFGKDVTAVVEALDLKQVVVLGFSMGAPVALEAALDMPDRVVGVILIDAIKNPRVRPTEAQIQALIARWREEYGRRDWVRSVGFNEATPASYIERCLEMIEPTAPERWWDSLAEASRWTGPRALEVLERIEAPVAAIASDRMPVDTATYHQYVPSFTVRTMPGVGHLGVLWRNTEDFDRHVRELVQAWTAPRAEVVGSGA